MTSFDSFTQNSRPSLRPLAHGQGARVVDVDGRGYLDFCSQTLNANLGHRHPAVEAAVVNQVERLHCASSRFSSDVAVELNDKLRAITPRPLARVNLLSATGSLANECAIKAVRKRTGRAGIVAWRDSHHGQSVETMRVSGKHWSRDYLGSRSATFVRAPDCALCPFDQSPDSCSAECLDEVDAAAAASPEVGCAIIEPIMVDAGVLTPPPRFHRRLREVCDEHDIALIWDEVQTGFGWLGTMFAMDTYGVVPDAVSLGKALGVGFPLAATLFREEYDVLTYGEHEMTAGAQPVACAASLAMISELETTDLLAQVKIKARLLHGMLRGIGERHPCVGDVRGMGLLAGIELVRLDDGTADSRLAEAVVGRLLEDGVIVRLGNAGGLANVVQLKPPLTIDHGDIEEAVGKIDRALRCCG